MAGSNLIHEIKTTVFIGNYIILNNATALIMIYTNPWYLPWKVESMIVHKISNVMEIHNDLDQIKNFLLHESLAIMLFVGFWLDKKGQVIEFSAIHDRKNLLKGCTSCFFFHIASVTVSNFWVGVLSVDIFFNNMYA